MPGNPNKRELRAIQPLIDKINAFEPTIEKLSDEELASKTEEFRSQLSLYLKGSMVLEDELVKLFREALDKIEPFAVNCTDEQLHAAITEQRQVIEWRHDPEYMLRDHLQDTLSECFENAYESLNSVLNTLRVTAAMDKAEETQEWPDEAEDPYQAILTLFKQLDPALTKIDGNYLHEAFEKAWSLFEEARHNALHVEDGREEDVGENLENDIGEDVKDSIEDGREEDVEENIDERLKELLSNVLLHLQSELVALKTNAMDMLIPEMAIRYKNGNKLENIMIEAFAVVREAARRTIQMRHFDEQLIGGVVLYQGKIAEMKTGEGKTLVATLPAYLHALMGKGVHIITTNDYLARRDAEWMGQVYEFLGLTVGVILNEVEPQSAERRANYQADIIYGTNHEFGFDYLRDNMVTSLEQTVQRELYFAIIDEVDNILIDEARTPLIISGQGKESTDLYVRFARWASRLEPEIDYTVEKMMHAVVLTEEGVAKIEQLAGIENLYDEDNSDLKLYMESALKAKSFYKRDRDYIVEDGEIIIVDDLTGRPMLGRRYGKDMHSSIEAKEGVMVQHETHTLATITFQNYFRFYEKLAGMTGTALTSAEEFHEIYKLDVIQIPTHKPMIRQDLPDLIYRTSSAKFNAVVEEIKECYEKGQPVLVGTTSIEASEHLSDLLDKQGIPHNVLNAKYHKREAQIVAQAGRSEAVTIATNMAGRGTDIVLGGNLMGDLDSILRKHANHIDYIRTMPERNEDERVEKEDAIAEYIENMTEGERDELIQEKIRECKEDHDRVIKLGGLHIVGTECHESRRIDNQLRGRAGRQGDPGSSRFFIALDDELMKRFAADRVAGTMDRVGMEEDVPLESKLVSRFIQGAQAQVERYNFDMRKYAVEYDDVIARQRELIYKDRRTVLERADMHERILGMIRDEVAKIVVSCIPSNVVMEEEELETLFKMLEVWVHIPEELIPENIYAVHRDQLKQDLTNLVIEHYEQRGEELRKQAQKQGLEKFDPLREFERSYLLQVVDRLWMDQIDALDMMRVTIGFRSVGQRDPRPVFKNEAFRMFDELKVAIRHYTVDSLLKLMHSELTISVNQPTS